MGYEEELIKTNIAGMAGAAGIERPVTRIEGACQRLEKISSAADAVACRLESVCDRLVGEVNPGRDDPKGADQESGVLGTLDYMTHELGQQISRALEAVERLERSV